ncbi:MAG: amidohydrolase, partial [Verrucomicrobiae bacterium]|nr:amidohydrolase [Verrucomicrobiae bacterium]
MKSALRILLLLSAGIITVPAEEARSLQDLATTAAPLPSATIFTAKEILTLDPEKPAATAVAVVGDKILAVGSLDELKKAAGDQPYMVDDTFAKQVIVPGFIGQHDHPLLAGLTMIAEIISIEDWVLPSGTVPAAKNREEYLKRLADANAALEDPEAVLLTWGFHHYFHGKLTRADLDEISATRPIIVWHRSAHEFILNSATMKKFGVTKEWFGTLKGSALEQSNFEEAHFWEQGAFAVMPLIASAIATPERLRQGLEFVEEYFHANGITCGCEPGGLLSKPLQ